MGGISKAKGKSLCPPGHMLVMGQVGASGSASANGLTLSPHQTEASAAVGIHAFN